VAEAVSTAPSIRGVLLDLDGTLLDTSPDLIGSLNALRIENGLSAMPAGHLHPVVSHGSAAMIQRGFNLPPEAPGFEALRLRFLDLYRARVSRATHAFDGMDSLLEALENASIPWGIVTNKPGWLAEPLLADLGYADRAACIIAGDTLPCRKPDPAPVLLACEQLQLAPRHCVLIGDAERDVQAGYRAGTLTLVALFGFIGAEDRVATWGADGLINHPLDTLQWLDPELLSASLIDPARGQPIQPIASH